MMFHHDGRSYEEATTHAGKAMRERLHKEIDEARAGSVTALQRIEHEVPVDAVVKASALDFNVHLGRLVVGLREGELPGGPRAVHPWALGQIAESLSIPKGYVQALIGRKDGTWGPELAAHNLTQLTRHREDKQLLRMVDGDLRGFLSPRYQRRNPGVLLDAFVRACNRFNLLPARAFCSDTKHGVHAVLDTILEPIPNEPIGIGVFYGESPFGNGATEVSVSIKRMWCSNLAVSEQNLRAVHSGGTLTEDVVWSEETYRKDTQLAASKIVDMLEACVGPASVVRLMDGIKLAHEKKITGTAVEAFLKKHLSKEDSREVVKLYNSADVEMLPARNTV